MGCKFEVSFDTGLLELQFLLNQLPGQSYSAMH